MRLLHALVLAFPLVSGAAAQDPSPRAIDIPPWFAETLLDFRDDVRDAAKRRQARDGLLRPGRLPVLHPADEGELLAARHRRQDAQALRRDRAQHLGRPGGDLDRRPDHEREGARARAQRAVHADAAVPGRAGADRCAAQRLLPAAPVRGGARLRRRQEGEQLPFAEHMRTAGAEERRARSSPTSRSFSSLPTTCGASPARSRSR